MDRIIREPITKMDNKFAQDMRILSKAATTNHPLVKYCISRYIELYIQKKVDMQLTNSIYTIFK